MSKEEKQALEVLECFEPDDLVECAMYRNCVTIVKNLIEKQQKEIENLKKKKYMLNSTTGEIKEIPLDDNYISKYIIKNKIQELEDTKLCGGAILKAVNEDKITMLQELLGDE